MFGGALLGLIPLGMCLSSGVWLWMKEVIRSGREVEWHSEQTRGQMVRVCRQLRWDGITDECRLPRICFPSPSSG